MGPGSKFDTAKDEVQDKAQAGTIAKSSIIADSRHQKPTLYGRILTRTASGIGLPVKEDDINAPAIQAFVLD